MGRELPSMRSLVALLILVGGACSYVLTDKAFELKGLQAYTWVTAYFVIISVEMAYGKHIVGPHLKFASMWGPTPLSTIWVNKPITPLIHDIVKVAVGVPFKWMVANELSVVGVCISHLFA